MVFDLVSEVFGDLYTFQDKDIGGGLHKLDIKMCSEAPCEGA